MKLPLEIEIAKKAYINAYASIREKLKANKAKYVGTKLEDCPPLIKEQGQFLVRKKEVDAIKAEMIAKYGSCDNSWAIWVTWFRRNAEKNSTKK